VALFAWDARLDVHDSVLEASDGGAGGPGSPGAPGSAGGSGGPGAPGADCSICSGRGAIIIKSFEAAHLDLPPSAAGLAGADPTPSAGDIITTPIPRPLPIALCKELPRASAVAGGTGGAGSAGGTGGDGAGGHSYAVFRGGAAVL
jgi:hypothetical protein